MEYHLTRSLRLDITPKHQSLYKWSINEYDADGRNTRQDQVPWSWSLSFTATACVLGDTLEIRSQRGDSPLEVSQSQALRFTLRAGDSRSDKDPLQRTTYSMFGTDRTLERFSLLIYPVTDQESESCTAWGIVSNTFEVDFRNATTPDCLEFIMYVKPETFKKYAARVSDGSVNELVLSVQSVAGFYSDWSPSISTGHIKILTDGSEQHIALPDGIQFDPPRLGMVGEARLYINRKLEFGNPGPDAVEAPLNAKPNAVPLEVPSARPTSDPSIVEKLGSLRKAAWVTVGLLALIWLSILSR